MYCYPPKFDPPVLRQVETSAGWVKFRLCYAISKKCHILFLREFHNGFPTIPNSGLKMLISTLPIRCRWGVATCVGPGIRIACRSIFVVVSLGCPTKVFRCGNYSCTLCWSPWPSLQVVSAIKLCILWEMLRVYR